MDLFYVTHPVEVSVRGYDRIRIPDDHACPYAFRSPVVPDPSPTIPWTQANDFHRLQFVPLACGADDTSRIYFACHPLFFKGLMAFEKRAQTPDGTSLVNLLTKDAEAELLSKGELPLQLDFCDRPGVSFVPLEDHISALGARHSVRIAVINSFNGAFGDTLVHLCVLRQVRRVLEAAFDAVRIDVLQHRCNPEAEALYLRSRLVQRIRYLPAPASQLKEYDAFFDVGHAYIGNEHCVDAALRMFSIDPASVSPEEKRMWLPPLPVSVTVLDPLIAEARARGPRLLLFHPLASAPTRSCAAPHAARLVREILDRSNFVVASAVPIDVEHPRYVDWSCASGTFDDFAYLIAHSDAIVSVDTCAYHVADAYDVPGVALFTTITPENRVRDYPYIAGLDVQPANNRLLLTNRTEAEYEADLDMAWHDLNTDRVLFALNHVMTEPTGSRTRRAGGDVFKPPSE